MARPLRILHVVDTLATGGLERFVTDLAIAQHRAGHAVSVFSMLRSEGFCDELQRCGVPVVDGDKRPGLDLGVLRRLRAAARSVDVVHSHNFVPNYYAALALLGTRRALINTCHNMGGRLTQLRLRWLYRLSLLRSARVATVGEAARNALLRIGGVPEAKVVAMHNGVPIERFHCDAAARRRARARLGLPEGAFVVGCVGRLVHLKNHALLLAQLPALCASIPGLHVVLVGDGPLASALRALATDLRVADHVVFAGARDDVSTLLPGFDLFCLPSTTEGLSIALLEACATGCTIVATAVGGNTQIIEDGVNGRLFASNDGEALCALVLQLANDRDERARLGQRARAYAVNKASMESIVSAYGRLYAEAINA